jgi:ribosomal protein S18 acetylase RimI-like enzyme
MGGLDYMKNKQISILVAKTVEEFADGRKLFEAYAASLNFNLCFQGFTEELNNLHQQYSAPNGALIIAYANTNAIAVVGIRQYEPQIAELKRMYTMPEYRGHKIGNKLLDTAILKAIELGYNKILLDTLPSMVNAISLYRAFGFVDIPKYRHNPFSDAIFMEKTLI